MKENEKDEELPEGIELVEDGPVEDDEEEDAEEETTFKGTFTVIDNGGLSEEEVGKLIGEFLETLFVSVDLEVTVQE